MMPYCSETIITDGQIFTKEAWFRLGSKLNPEMTRAEFNEAWGQRGNAINPLWRKIR